MSLSTEYRRVIKRGDRQPPHTSVHALMPGADETMCGIVDALDVEYPKNVNYVVTCGACNKMLKKERQRRSREGTARYQERRAAEAPAERDTDLILAMQARATALRDDGFEDLAATLEIAAGRLSEHEQ